MHQSMPIRTNRLAISSAFAGKRYGSGLRCRHDEILLGDGSNGKQADPENDPSGKCQLDLDQWA
jgi:hypothetical protein